MKALSVLSIILIGSLLSCIPSGRDYGKELYNENCANCHGAEGNGLQKLYPPLKNSDYLIENQKDLACLIRFGSNKPMIVNGITYNDTMPGKPLLSDIDIHNIINYISKNINSELKQVKLNEVNDQLMNCNRY
jgi:mono/diheme cytochrome c family protein